MRPQECRTDRDRSLLHAAGRPRDQGHPGAYRTGEKEASRDRDTDDRFCGLPSSDGGDRDGPGSEGRLRSASIMPLTPAPLPRGEREKGRGGSWRSAELKNAKTHNFFISVHPCISVAKEGFKRICILQRNNLRS